jgi:integrase
MDQTNRRTSAATRRIVRTKTWDRDWAMPRTVRPEGSLRLIRFTSTCRTLGSRPASSIHSKILPGSTFCGPQLRARERRRLFGHSRRRSPPRIRSGALLVSTASCASWALRIDLRWHDLRHEGACRLHADGVDIRIIQLMLGHASSRRDGT